MPRAPARPIFLARVPSTLSILVLLDGLDRHDVGAPAAIAFRTALARKGREADIAGGPQAIDDLLSAIAEADPARADTRIAIVRAAWADLMPGSGGRARA